MGSSPHLARLAPPARGLGRRRAHETSRALRGARCSEPQPGSQAATQMRSRLLIDGAITAYRDGRTDETLEASESRRLQLHEEMFDTESRPCSGDLDSASPKRTRIQISTRRMTTIEIDVQGRWDALALSELLIPFHSFLVQHDHERWVVHARAPGCRGESLSGRARGDRRLAQRRGASSSRVVSRRRTPLPPSRDESCVTVPRHLTRACNAIGARTSIDSASRSSAPTAASRQSSPPDPRAARCVEAARGGSANRSTERNGLRHPSSKPERSR